MRTLRMVGKAGLVVALVALWVAPAQAEIKLGQVDIVTLVDNYERTKDAEADAKVEEASLKTTAEPRIKQIEEIRLQRDGFNKDSDEWRRLDDKAFEAEVELRTWLAIEQARMIRKRRDTLLDIYRDIQKAVARIAKEKGLDLVFAKAFLTPGQIDAEQVQNLADLKQHIVATALLYPASVTDITDGVLKILNDEYKASKKPAEIGTPKAAPAEAPRG
ncbi:MAG: OmpH family outer membrane protein [Phycisphaerae bacterium]|nr:OmpH family outer membrane protein [Phycisphaerae bacterium]